MSTFVKLMFCLLLFNTVGSLFFLAFSDYPRRRTITIRLEVIGLVIELALLAWTGQLLFGGAS